MKKWGANSGSVLSERQISLDFIGHIKTCGFFSCYDGKLLKGFEWNMAQSDVYLIRII